MARLWSAKDGKPWGGENFATERGNEQVRVICATLARNAPTLDGLCGGSDGILHHHFSDPIRYVSAKRSIIVTDDMGQRIASLAVAASESWRTVS